MQSQWDSREAVLLLAEDPAKRSFREFPEFITSCNNRVDSGDDAGDSKLDDYFAPTLIPLPTQPVIG